MLKLSNETKVGVLTVLGITLLVLGFNLLKGKSLFSHNKTIYAVYQQVNGLQPANAVQVNGLVVGNVANLEVMDKDASRILVAITITKKIEIPRNSVARISSDLLGTKTVQLDQLVPGRRGYRIILSEKRRYHLRSSRRLHDRCTKRTA
jgi:phospholipid/cholesterol/gamma-HCH transport system substrate-binding protein